MGQMGVRRMLRNNNQAAVSRIYHRMLKQNKVRNVIVILAIVLTTFMFTAVFTLGFSIAKNLNQMQLRLQGTRSSIYMEHPSEGQINDIKSCPSLLAAGIQIDAQTVSTESGKYSYLLQYDDDTEFNENLKPAITDIKGSYPKDENEIMLTKQILDNMGITSPKVGQNVTFVMDGERKNFVLSGWYTGFAKSSVCLVSKKYVDSQGIDMQKDGRVSISAKEGKGDKLQDELEKNVTLRQGQKFDVKYDVQSENGSNRVFIAISIGIIALMILLSGYLLIYNVMYISVTKDIRIYGMLKTIGATMSQIQKIVKKQALISGLYRNSDRCTPWNGGVIWRCSSCYEHAVGRQGSCTFIGGQFQSGNICIFRGICICNCIYKCKETGKICRKDIRNRCYEICWKYIGDKI